MSDEQDEQDPEEIQRQALEDAAHRVHYFNGKKLNPFSFGRQTAAQRLDMSSDSPLESAILLIYLCFLGDEIVSGNETGIDRIDRARGAKGVREFRKEMNAWADSQKIKFGSKLANEASKVANQIWEDLLRSETVPESQGGSAKGPKKNELPAEPQNTSP